MHRNARQQTRNAGVIFAALVMMGGCATTGSPGSDAQVTYEWEANSRVAQLHFADNHRACTQDADTMGTYENCMAGLGYTPVEP